jgi:hypothetical protein
MSSTSNNKKENRDDETNANIDINNKTKRKRLDTSKVFEDEEDESRITFTDKKFLYLNQENLAKEFLLKHPNNNIHIFPKKYEPEGKKRLFS